MNLAKWNSKAITVQMLISAGDMALIVEWKKQNLNIDQKELKKINTMKTNTLVMAAEEQKLSTKKKKEENGKMEKELNDRIIYNALRNNFLDQKEIPHKAKSV